MSQQVNSLMLCAEWVTESWKKLRARRRMNYSGLGAEEGLLESRCLLSASNTENPEPALVSIENADNFGKTPLVIAPLSTTETYSITPDNGSSDSGPTGDGSETADSVSPSTGGEFHDADLFI